ncbi:MAG: hypothetical protein RL177_1647, partial [Bacteroidota bacterium]
MKAWMSLSSSRNPNLGNTAAVGSLYVPDSSFAQQVGFQTGDRLVSVNGQRPESYKGGNFFTMADLTSSSIVFQVERDSQIIDITAPAGFIDQLNKQPKFISLENALPSEISNIVVGSVAESAGIQSGDRIISVDSVSVDRWLHLTTLIKESEGELALGIVRGN